MAGYREELFQKLFLNGETSKENVGVVEEIANLWDQKDYLLAKILLKKISEKRPTYSSEPECVCIELDKDKNTGLQFYHWKKGYYFEFCLLGESKRFSKAKSKLQNILNEAQIHPIGTKATVEDTVWKKWEEGTDNFEYVAKNIDKCASEIARVLGEIEKAYHNA